MPQDIVVSVFKILAALMLTLILYTVVMGSVGRTIMWSAIEPAIQTQWSMSTMEDGRVFSDLYGDMFDNTKEYTNPAK